MGKIIYQAVIGSQAYGLAGPTSDIDLREVFLSSALDYWGLNKGSDHYESIQNGEDVAGWEFEKFLRMVLNQNPNSLEVLWTPHVKFVHPVFAPLIELRPKLLSKGLVKSYMGYANAQFIKMQRNPNNIDWKNASHLIRLMMAAIHALKQGEIMVQVPPSTRNLLLSIKQGEMSYQSFLVLRDDMESQFQQARTITKLPDEPDYQTANQLLIQTRIWAYNQSW
jgi:uncharacterized protein